MKKRIGLIDLYIDEWHANNYPGLIANSSRSREFEIGAAWEKASHPQRRPLSDWCREMQIPPAKSLSELVDDSDCIMVLAPNNPESHEELAEYALKSGKPLYIDKPFAPSLAVAQRLFTTAANYHTPLMSTSALRYCHAVRDFPAPGAGNFACTFGGGQWFEVYAVHQVEMIVCVLGTGAYEVLVESNGSLYTASIRYADGRIGRINFHPQAEFQLIAQSETTFISISKIQDTFFAGLIDSILKFFTTGVSTVTKSQTCEVMAILEAINRGSHALGQWIDVPHTVTE